MRKYLKLQNRIPLNLILAFSLFFCACTPFKVLEQNQSKFQAPDDPPPGDGNIDPNCSTNKLTALWDPPKFPDGTLVPGVEGYVVSMGTTSGTYTKNFMTIETTQRIGGLGIGTYYAAVKAIYSNGESPYSNEASIEFKECPLSAVLSANGKVTFTKDLK